MRTKISRAWLRRLAAHLTAPLVVALGWALTTDGPFLHALGATVWLCYIAWLIFGLPGALLRRSRPLQAWAYPACAAAVPAFYLTLIGSGWRSGDWSLYAFVPIFAVAGFWYWLCAYWGPGPSGQEAVEAT